MKKSMKIVCSILTAAMLMTGITACGNTGEETLPEGASLEETVSDISGSEEDNGVSEQNEGNAVQDTMPGSDFAEEAANNILAQISEIDGNTITLALAEQPAGADMSELPDGIQPEGGGSEIPSGGMPTEKGSGGERPKGGGPDGEKPADRRSAGEAPDSEMPQMQFTFTGETMTIEITDSTIITVDGEAATIEDLSVEDVVTVIMEGENVNSIISGFGRDQNPTLER